MENDSLKVLYEELLNIKRHIDTIVDKASAQDIGDDYVGIVTIISDVVDSTIKSAERGWLESLVECIEFPDNAEGEWSYDVAVMDHNFERELYLVSFARLDDAREYVAELFGGGGAMHAIIKRGWKMPLYDCRLA